MTRLLCRMRSWRRRARNPLCPMSESVVRTHLPCRKRRDGEPRIAIRESQRAPPRSTSPTWLFLADSPFSHFCLSKFRGWRLRCGLAATEPPHRASPSLARMWSAELSISAAKRIHAALSCHRRRKPQVNATALSLHGIELVADSVCVVWGYVHLHPITPPLQR